MGGKPQGPHAQVNVAPEADSRCARLDPVSRLLREIPLG